MFGTDCSSLVRFILWSYFTADTPSTHPRITQEELDYLNRELGKQNQQKKSQQKGTPGSQRPQGERRYRDHGYFRHWHYFFKISIMEMIFLLLISITKPMFVMLALLTLFVMR